MKNVIIGVQFKPWNHDAIEKRKNEVMTSQEVSPFPFHVWNIKHVS